MHADRGRQFAATCFDPTVVVPNSAVGAACLLCALLSVQRKQLINTGRSLSEPTQGGTKSTRIHELHGSLPLLLLPGVGIPTTHIVEIQTPHLTWSRIFSTITVACSVPNSELAADFSLTTLEVGL